MKPIFLGLVAFAGLMLMGAGLIPSILVALIPVVCGWLAIATGTVYALSALLLALGLIWAATQIYIGPERTTAVRDKVSSEFNRVIGVP